MLSKAKSRNAGKSILLMFTIVSMFVLTSCSKEEETPLPAGYHKVEVEDKIDASNYTYLQVSENGNEYWIAVPQMKVEDGEVLYFSKSMEMKNFRSKTLNRTFESVLFVDDISRSLPNKPQMMTAHPKVNSSQKVNVTVPHLEDGKTIAQIYAEKESFAGKRVRVRGMVTKYNPAIMDMNWIHIQDGTGDENNYDIVVTTKDISEMGKVIVVEGTVELNKDYGSGYSYPIVIENAKVK
jgi:hypothetical protein